jgi:putative DNA primase/helicase
MDRLFRQSGLMQGPERKKKWDRPTAGSTYGAITIDKAIANTTETSTPPARSKRAGKGEPP